MSDASDVEGRDNESNRYDGSDGIRSDDSDAETAEEKRLRLAKKYLEEIERQGNCKLSFLDSMCLFSYVYTIHIPSHVY